MVSSSCWYLSEFDFASTKLGLYLGIINSDRTELYFIGSVLNYVGCLILGLLAVHVYVLVGLDLLGIGFVAIGEAYKIGALSGVSSLCFENGDLD
jgi:hypothetical protein